MESFQSSVATRNANVLDFFPTFCTFRVRHLHSTTFSTTFISQFNKQNLYWYKVIVVMLRNAKCKKGISHSGVHVDMTKRQTYDMSTIQIPKWESAPQEILAVSLPVKEDKKLQPSVFKCIVCSGLKTPYIFDESIKPLVLRCIKCGHKSWASF